MSEFEQWADYFIKPNFKPVSELASHYRRLMLFYSSIALFVVFGSTGIDYEQSTFLGIKFLDVNTSFVFSVLLCSIIYFYVCFVLEGVHGYMECRFRLTGLIASKKSYDNVDASIDIELNSNLYTYFNRYVRRSEEAYLFVSGQMGAESKNLVEELEKFLELNKYLSTALKRFDDGFIKAQRLKLVSWIAYEFAVPLVFGAFAIISLFIYKILPIASYVLSS